MNSEKVNEIFKEHSTTADARDLPYTKQFLNELFGNKFDEAIINIWTLPDKKSHFFRDLDDAVKYIAQVIDEGYDIYVQCGLLAKDLGHSRRGKKEDIIGLPGFYMDIDLSDPIAHEKDKLPSSVEEALKLVEGHGWDPTLIVHSGHGLHVWWLFKEPWMFNSENDRNAAEVMNARLQATIIERANKNGWQLDSTFDITRVLRVVGTYNRKDPANPILVELLENTGNYYSDPMDFDKLLIEKDELKENMQSAEKEKTQITGDLNLDRDAEPPAEKFKEMCEIEPRFFASWNANRSDLSKQSASEYALSLANFAVQGGWTDQEVADLIIAFYRKHEKDSKFRKKDGSFPSVKKALRQDFITATIAKARVGSSSGGEKIKIDAKSKDLPKVNRQAFEAIKQTNSPPELFNMEGKIVRLKKTDGKRPRVQILEVPDLRYELSRRADWFEKRKIKNTEIDVPSYPNDDICRDILATANLQLPELTGITEMPFCTCAGTVQCDGGYSKFSKCYLHDASDLQILPASDNPEKDEVDEAKRMIFDDILSGFPFKTHADKINALGILLVPYVRRMIDGPTPLHAISANSAGIGKSLLVECFVLLSIGYTPQVTSECRDDESWSKKITAKLHDLPDYFIIDNVKRKLDSGALSSALTASIWEDRLLSKSKMVSCRVNCCWIVNGINLDFSTEISRRVVPIRLYTEDPKPWLRDFSNFRHPDICLWIKNNRPRLLWAVFTLINRWKAVGMPAPIKLKNKLGSYESYCRIIAGILEANGIMGFLDNLLDFYDEYDHETAQIEAFVRSWWDEYDSKKIFVGELLDLVEDNDIDVPIAGNKRRGQLISLGKYLNDNRDRNVGGFRIKQGNHLDGKRTWYLEFTYKVVNGLIGNDGIHNGAKSGNG